MTDNMKTKVAVKDELKNNQPSRDNRRKPFSPQKRFSFPDERQPGMNTWDSNGPQRRDMVMEKLEKLSGPTTNLESQTRKFSGRCRLFVGNLPSSITEEGFRKMFESFGEVTEANLFKQKGFGFIKLDSRENARCAKLAIDGTSKDGKQLNVRFAQGSVVKVKNLPQYVSNELLEAAFAVFGDVERAVVVVDDRDRPVGEGIVEYAKKQSAQLAVKYCTDRSFLLTSSLQPVTVEALDARDEDDGLPEKNIQKGNLHFSKERSIGPRLAEPGSFEYEFGNRYKQLFDLEKQKREHLDRQIKDGRRALYEQMDLAFLEHEANLLRERLRNVEQQNSFMQQEREFRREEERKRDEAYRQTEMMFFAKQNEILGDNKRSHPESDLMMKSQPEHDQNSRSFTIEDPLAVSDPFGPNSQWAPLTQHSTSEDINDFETYAKRLRY